MEKQRDFSCEFAAPRSYVEFITHHFSQAKNRDDRGGLYLDQRTADAFMSMLVEVECFLMDVDETLNGDDEVKAA